MSTILKALRRLEQEKRRKERPLREQVASASGDEDRVPRRRWPVLLGGMVSGVAAGLAVLFVFLHEDGREDPSGPEASVSTQERRSREALTPRERRQAAARAGVRGAEDGAAARAERRRRGRGDTGPATAPPAVSPDVVVVEREAPTPRIRAEVSPDPAPSSAAAPLPGTGRPFPAPAALPSPHILPEGPGALLAVPEAGAQRGANAESPRPAPPPAVNREPARTAGFARAGSTEPTPTRGPDAATATSASARREGSAEPDPMGGHDAATREIASSRTAPAPAPARARTESRAKERGREEAAAGPLARDLPAGEQPTTAAAAPPFPALQVERTLWHPVAERRMAVVAVPGEGARSVREGDQVEGAIVTLIEPSGVVFLHAGREVRRRVGGGS